MNYTVGEDYLAVEKYPDEAHVMAAAQNCELGYLVLQDSRGADVYWELIRLVQGRQAFGLVVSADDLGLSPHLLLGPGQQRLVLGFGRQIAFFDIAERQLDVTQQLESVFYRFFSLSGGYFIALHELGLLALTYTGHEVWRYNAPDMVTEANLEQGLLRIHFFEGGQQIIRAVDGYGLG